MNPMVESVKKNKKLLQPPPARVVYPLSAVYSWCVWNIWSFFTIHLLGGTFIGAMLVQQGKLLTLSATLSLVWFSISGIEVLPIVIPIDGTGRRSFPFTVQCSQFQVTCYSPENNMEPENHLFEKEKNIFQTFIFRFYTTFQGWNFWAGFWFSNLTSWSFLCVQCAKKYLFTFYTEPKGHETKGLKLYFFLLPSLKLT